MTEIGKKDKLPVKSRTAIAKIEPGARKELINRGLRDLADAHDADSYFFKGEDSRLRGEYGEAISNYEKALQIDPEHENSLFWMGYCYLLEGEEVIGDDLDLDNTIRNERAVSVFQKLIAILEKKDRILWEDYITYYNLGLAQYNLELYEEATESFEHAKELNPDDANSHHMLGLAQYNLELYEEATESFEHAKELNQSHEGRQERIKELERSIAELEKKILDLDARKRSRSPEPDATPQSEDDPYSKLEKLASLKEKGIISEEEFEQEKKKILGN